MAEEKGEIRERLKGLRLGLVGLKEEVKKLKQRKWLKKLPKPEQEQLNQRIKEKEVELKSVKKQIKECEILLKIPELAKPKFLARIRTETGEKKVKVDLDETGHFEYAGGIYNVKKEFVELFPESEGRIFKKLAFYRGSYYLEGKPDPVPPPGKEIKLKFEEQEHAGDRKIRAEMRTLWLAFLGNLMERTGVMKPKVPAKISVGGMVIALIVALVVVVGYVNWRVGGAEKDLTEALEVMVSKIPELAPLPAQRACLCCPPTCLSSPMEMLRNFMLGCQGIAEGCQAR